ncbi:conserved hypothetical protein [Leishmania braziliensis MHOM/BR/75/M2904]|uniref:Uncharacterized protein n=2 Tax=Leishmania braziliensis TaxID=5660 RepID=A4H8Y8_LEIBR|nr:conserved hypothetical protein [Leishmania braziliensis MHOM/BR/75/M2904]CAJ2470028.1 unnamed protein product [Leishmania braziliensis]CAM37856.2 conserved hypothetical protein [Leishmania braziliensis MHOM/BR/75/M2904]SYZ64526.1 hypothetical_protein [Leishmania braziliensis MHOM/BR/75/M2904]
MSAEHSHADGDVDAPSFIYLGEPLPSSVMQLGLSLNDSLLTSTAEVTPAAASLSFRVRAMHLDDVAEDVILVCEDSITLCVPLTWSGAAAATPSDLEGYSRPERSTTAATTHDNATRPAYTAASTTRTHHRSCSPHAHGELSCLPSRPSPSAPPASQSSILTSSGAAAAACLRMANPLQVWASPLSPSCCTTASTSGLCLPRRLPMPHAELRSSASVLMAVPLPPPAALSSSASSTSRDGPSELISGSVPVSGHDARVTPPPVMAVYIMECPVLPEGVDYIEASSIPLARPLARIVCAPNTLRFREAWYPIQFFCWCDSAADAATSTTAASPPYVDHHLLCVSSITVDLIRVRCRIGLGLSPQSPHSPPASMMPSPLPSCGSGGTREGECIERTTSHAPFVSPANAATAASLAPSSFTTSFATTGGVCDGAALVLISVLQRYVTRSDWCTYDARGRVLLSLNYARPSVVKPIKVYRGQGASSVDNERSTRSNGIAEVSSSPLELCTWTELTLSESLRATPHMSCTSRHGTAAGAAAAALSDLPLPVLRSQQISHQLSSMLGVLTVYGQSFVYHVLSGLGTIGGQHEPVMNLHMYLPSEGSRGRPLSGVSQTGRALSSGVTGASVPASAPEASGGDSLLRRLKAAASLATASAPPPGVCGGSFIHVAQLSLAAVTSCASRASQAAVPAPLADTLEADELTATLLRPPSLGHLCVQVVDNLIVIHAPATAQLAVFDLADCSISSASQMKATAAFHHARRRMTARRYLWKAVASGAIDSRVRFPNPAVASPATSTAASADCFSELASSWEARGGAVSASQGMGNSNISITDSADDTFAAASRSSLPPPPTAFHPSADASSGAQVTTTSELAAEHRQQQFYRSRGRKAALQRQAPSANFPSMLSVLRSSMLELTAWENPIAASAVPLMYPLYCCSATAVVKACEAECAGGSRDALSGGKPVVYGDYQWLASSQVPLVINASDGTLRVCRVDAARVAEWRLLVDLSRGSEHSDQYPWPRQQGQGLDVNTLNGDTAAGLVRSYVRFLCRRHQMFSAPLAKGRSTGSVYALVGLLRELAGQVVGLAGDDSDGNAASVSQADQVECAEVDILRRLLCTTTTSTLHVAGNELYALWKCILANLTLETEFSLRCVAVELESTVAPAGGAGSASGAGAASSEASGGLPITSTALQRLILQTVFSPTWTALQSSCLPRHPQQQDQRRRQLEGLLCDYILLLHSAAIPVELQLQYLLLEVILCHVADTSTRRLESPQPTSACSAARRVQELLRQGILEPSDATARWLLDWWSTNQKVRASTQCIGAADASARRLSARGSSQEYRSEQPDAVATVPLPLAVATTTPQRSAEMLFSRFGPRDSTEETEVLFGEAVRLLEVHGSLLEVAEAYSWRSDFTAAAAVLKHVPHQSKFSEVPGVASWSALSHRGQTRALSWDTLALSVLDGAWRYLRWAEEALFSHTDGAPATSKRRRIAPDLASNPPKSWQLRSLERQVQDAHRMYVTVATTLLGKPTTGALSPSPVIEAADFSQGSLASSTAANVDGRFHAHEVHYEQLCRHMEQDWHDLKLRGGA